MATAATVKCGYCNYILGGFLGNIMQHSCFQGFDPNIQAIHIDDNGMLTMINQTENKSADDSMLDDGVNKQDDDVNVQSSEDENDSSQSWGAGSFSTGVYDEQLISLVQAHPALYDHRLPSAQRSKLKKKDIWKVISNNFEGELFTPANAEKRWNYLRENYLKARKKFQAAQYKAHKSGSGSSSVVQPKFRYYQIMDFLNESVTFKTTLSSLNVKSAAKNVATTNSKSYERPKTLNKENFNSNENVTHEAEDLMNLNNPRTVLSASNSMLSASALHTSQASTSKTPLSTNSTPQNSRKRKNADIENQLLQLLQKEVKETDEVDGFLLRLGAGLKRLSYQTRARLEIKFLTLLNEEEELDNVFSN